MSKTLAIVCFGLSGFAGLVYEICWIRQASLVFGSTTFALSSVLAIFFAGLALGSYLFGRIAQRLIRPLRLYAALELLLAAMVLLSPAAFGLADNLYGPVYRSQGGATALLFIVRFLLIALVILPPTVVMGGTLPLFCRQFVTRADRIAGSIGYLYGINTLGAAIGCVVTGLVLLPELGMVGSIRLAAAMNILAGLTVGLLPLRVAPVAQEVKSQGAGPQGAEAQGETRPSRYRAVVGALFFATGLVALGQEVVWTRFLALLVRNSVYTYTITLTVVLVGIVLGSLLAARLFDRVLPRATSFGALQVLSGLMVLTLLMLPVTFWRGLGQGIAPFFVLALGPAILAGAAFPLAIRMVLDDPRLSALSVGRMAALNTLGGIVGALLIGFVGLPVWGLAASLRMLTALALTSGFVAWLALARTTPLQLRLGLVILASAVWFVLPLALDTRLPADFLAPRQQLVDYQEGYTSSLAMVRNKGALQLEIDRLWQGKDIKTHQIMAAHVPMLLHPSARQVLVVGVGTGQTASRFLFYDLDRLDCVDIEPVIFPFIRRHYGTGWMEDTRVGLIPDDGRTYIAHTDASYDLISLEVGQVFRPGVATFYSREFYDYAAARLRPGGLLSQFVPLPFFTVDDFRSVLRTFLEVFPESILWYNSSELLLIGIKGSEISIDRQRLELVNRDEQLRQDLAYSQWGGPPHWLNDPGNFLAGFLCGPAELAVIAEDAPLLTDDRPTLAYATSRVRAGQRLEVESVQLLRQHLSPFAALLRGSLSAAEETAIEDFRSRNLRDIVSTAYLRTADELQAILGPERAAQICEVALEWNPDNAQANRMLGEAMALLRRLPEAEKAYRKALNLQTEDPLSQRGLAFVLLQTEREQEAIPHLEHALALMPQDAATLNYLGAAFAQQGKLREAIGYFREALKLHPDDASLQLNLERAESELQKTKGR